MSRRGVTLLSFVLLNVAAVASGRPLVIDDLYQLRTVAEPQVSPDGAWVAYSVTRPHRERDAEESDIWMVSWDGRQDVQLTRSAGNETQPRWSRDGRYLAFLADRGDPKEESQIRVLDRTGGESRQLTQQPGGVTSFSWSPDGRQIVFAADVDPQKSVPEKSTAEKPKPIVIDRLQFKQDAVGYLTTSRSHLFLVDVATGATTPLTDGRFDETLPRWSPDGSQIAFMTKRGDDPDRHDNWDVHVIEPRAGATDRQLTTNPGTDGDTSEEWGVSVARFSPDGTRVAYLQGGPPELIWYGLVRIAVIPAAGGDAALPTAALDRNTVDPQWSQDGKWLYFRLEDDRSLQLARVRLRDGRLERLTAPGGAIYAYDVGAANRIAAVATFPDRPAELAAVENGKLRWLTRQNQAWLQDVELAETRPIEFLSADTIEVHGLMTVPRSARPASGYPTLLHLHGGPVSQHAYEFDFTRQLFAASGYAVIAPNPRGSTGRGERFQRMLWADWGHADVPDVLAAVDHAVRAGVADSGRLGVGGWSYGAILTNYVIASDPRFRAAFSGSGMANMLSSFGTDHYIRGTEREIGLPWANTDLWLRLSYPFFKADRIRTPTLFLCGELDFNVPLVGSEQMYQALRRLDVPTQLVIYPGQYHYISRPSFQHDKLRRYLDWFDKYLAAQ
jgi:dipeptidyl aminopeptidase/acylaminoacyl peptidase